MTDQTIPVGETNDGVADGDITPNQPVDLPVEEILTGRADYLRATAGGSQ
ncbi:hypothetical protein [Halonotius aquaticus]|nr:hypothetical protein [Halonotius aquaticus]